MHLFETAAGMALGAEVAVLILTQRVLTLGGQEKHQIEQLLLSVWEL